MKEQIVLPADVYDTYELSCEAYGGVGAFSSWEDRDVPLCVLGHAQAASGGDYDAKTMLVDPLRNRRSGIAYAANDIAVVALIGEVQAKMGQRVSWAAYCARRGIVRGA